MNDLETIWKYVLPADDRIIPVSMPVGANILCAQTQGDNIVLWATVNPQAEEGVEIRNFRVFGTGQVMPDPQKMWHHIGTCQMAAGTLIWHVFEDIK